MTKALEFETRQHSLLGIDFGEGIPRTALVFGGGILTIWAGMLWLIFGAPNRFTVLFYFTIPLVVVYYAFQDDPKRPRRKRIAAWVNRARYALRGHRPLVARRLSRNREDLLPASYRYGLRQFISVFKGRGEDGVWDTTIQHAHVTYAATNEYRISLKAHINSQ